MGKFSYKIAQTRAVNFNQVNLSKAHLLEETVPSFKRCISCGCCSAACSARMFTDFNIRRIHSRFKRGQYEGLAEEMEKCMLCGKCMLVCPRGVNLRSLIINMRQILDKNHENL